MDINDSERDGERALRRQKRAEARRRRRRDRNIKRLKIIIPALCAAVAVCAAVWKYSDRSSAAETPPPEPAETQTVQAEPEEKPYSASETADTAALGDEIDSGYAVVIDVDSGKIVAEKNASERISIASMTKILTLLVAAEHLTAADLDKTVEITTDVTDVCYQNGCSVAGFELGEKPTVRDLLYGTILPSGADAALALASYVAPSQEAFAAMMNDRLASLGISDAAHFTNCIGLYDAEHYCSVYGMAMIMKAASENAICRGVMAAHTYTTAPTAEHPEGMILSNWFLRRIEDKDCGSAKVLYAKTGFVAQSGSCAASLAETESGKRYICVTAMASSSWRCIYDHAALYKKFAG
jgi:D-alanyl-D-alanine carboxypeptidase (penicillin-binding protein 5/6)